MQQIHVNTIFQLYIPVEGGDPNGFTFTQTTTPHFGIILTQNDTQESFYYLLHVVVSEEASETVVENCLSFAKRHPHRFQTKPSTSSIDGLILQLKINGGIFDFRKTKQRQIRFVLECSKHDTLLLAKRRFAGDEMIPYDDVIVPIFWRPYEFHSSEDSAQKDLSSPNQNDPESLMLADNSDDTAIHSDDIVLSVSPHDDNVNNEHNFLMTRFHGENNYEDDNDEQYMVLYNGNAEVVGNFRALNFYKASDINIKEDIRLLRDDYDPRGVLMKIDGVEYKFKRGVSKTTNKRFVGYIAQQIESVVPEAVQLIDGILHVDYESLIPYLSESIKQNFKDITDLNSKTTQIHQVVDMMYSDFIKKERQKPNNVSSSNDDVIPMKSKRSKKYLRYLIPLVIATFAIIGVLMGLNYIPIAPTPTPSPRPLPTIPNSPPSLNTPVPTVMTPTSSVSVPTSILSPMPRVPLPPRPDNLSDKRILIELFNTTNGPYWSVQWDFNSSMCDWLGVTCSTSQLNNVEQLNLSQFSLSGTIPASLSGLKQLKVLDLSSNHFTGTIPIALSSMKLQRLILSNNELRGTVPESLFTMSTLLELQLDQNPFTGWSVPNDVRQLKQLQILNLDNTNVTYMPPEINLPSLVKVSFSNNPNLRGLLRDFSSSSLIELRASNTDLFCDATSLSSSIQVLHVARLSFEGLFPLEHLLQHMTNLKDLDIEGVGIEGSFSLPASVLKTIERLNIAGNELYAVQGRNMFQIVPTNLVWCHADQNFYCPVPNWMKEKCNVKCGL